MLRPLMLLPLALLLPLGRQPKPTPPPADLAYTADGQMVFPAHYREWIYLTSGLDMSYNPSAQAATNSIFDNVFVNPAAYRTFMETGTWPDKAVFILEIRGAAGDVSINKRGKTQTHDIRGIEVHVKDASLPGKWGFFEFNGPSGNAKLVPRPADCYTCHEAHAAVDTTFVQFYPTLVPIATEKGTYRIIR